MKKNVNIKIAIPALLGVLVLVILLKSLGILTFRSGVRIGFSGSNGAHKFTGSYSKITGTMIHNLKPSKDSNSIHCEITTKSGTLHVLITQKNDDKVLFDKEISGDETVDLTAEGTVTVKLHTKGHSGSYRFEY